jgi:hypothetical protein
LARTVIRARGGTGGVDSVNDFRLQEVSVHHHFRFSHTIRGMSGPILMSRGRVVAHPFDRDDRGRAPRAHSHPIDGGRDVDGAGSVDIDVLGLDDDTVESEQQ